MYRELPQSGERGWGETLGTRVLALSPPKPRSPSQSPSSSLLRHSSVAVAAERRVCMSSSVPCRCRMKLLSWPEDRGGQGSAR